MEENFRQVGVAPTGRLLIGSAHSHHAAHVLPRPAVTTIPSKSETQLYKRIRSVARDGFSNRTARFKRDLNDIPGPGAYDGSQKGALELATFNKRAKQGACSSKVNRWQRVSNEGAIVFEARMPGPGSYHVTDFIQHEESKNFNQAETTSAFSSRTCFPRNWPKGVPYREATPGPGAYEGYAVQTQRRNRRDRGVQILEKKLAKRVSSAPQWKKTPLPSGDYIWETVPPKVSADALSIAHTNRCVDQPFLSTTQRFSEPDPLGSRAPAPGQYDPQLPTNIPQMRAPFQSKTPRHLHSSTEYPGPGAYNANVANQDTSNKQSSYFVTGSADRFGVQLEKRTPNFVVPGPGAYTDFSIGGRVRPGKVRGYPMGQQSHRDHSAHPSIPSTATFRKYQEMKRSRLRGHTAPIASSNTPVPGPAYYKPHKAEALLKRSFHLNNVRKWMA